MTMIRAWEGGLSFPNPNITNLAFSITFWRDSFVKYSDGDKEREWVGEREGLFDEVSEEERELDKEFDIGEEEEFEINNDDEFERELEREEERAISIRWA